MDAHKTKSLKQHELKLYNCTFELELFQLRIFLRFPCKFFVEWKTTSGNNITKTEGFVQNHNGKVEFNQKLTMQIQMLYDTSKHTWIRKDSTISVYLVTRNKPDFNQLVGRINIDLSIVCEENPYEKPFTESLTHASASADLKFSLNMKYSPKSQKSISQLNLLEFNQRISLVKQQDNLSKSKSVEYLKNAHHVVSPVHRIIQSPVNASQKGVKPFHFPVSRLVSYGHQVHEVVKQEDEKHQPQFNTRMTLGSDKKKLSREDYENIIEQQTKGMKKSDLMVVPDMKKSGIQNSDSEFNTDHSKKSEEEYLQASDIDKNQPLKNIGSLNYLKKGFRTRQSVQSDIDIVVDLSEAPQIKDLTQQNQMQLKNSINSSNSFSISKFKAQLEGVAGEKFTKNHSPKDSITSMQMPALLKKPVSSGELKDNHESMIQKYEASKNRVKQLETDVSQLVNMLANAREKVQKLEDDRKERTKRLQSLTYENAELQKKVDELQERANYESRINQINCEKLKRVSSQLTQQKRKTSKSEDLLPNIESLHQLKNLREKLNKLTLEKEILEEKLFKRDEIELQNEIRIQELEEELTRYRTQKLNSAPKVIPSALDLESRIVKNEPSKQNEYASFLEQKIQTLELQNIKIKDMCNEAYKSIEVHSERDQRMKENVFVVEKQFQAVVKLLIERQRLLKEKFLEINDLKKKLLTSNFSQSTLKQLKHKYLEQDLKKKDQMLQFSQNQIRILQQELTKLQLQNKQLLEIQKNHFRESLKFEGDLKVIKEEENFRESLASSTGQNFRLSFSTSRLSTKEENAVTWYKLAIQSYNSKYNIDANFELQFTGQSFDLRKKAFNELERSAKVINDLLVKNSQLKTKIDQLEEQQKNYASSTKLIHSKPLEQQTLDQYSQSNKKRSTLSIGNQSKLSREVQKLKSLLYDKNKEMADLIASHEKLKLQKQTQALLMKSKKVHIKKPSINNDEESDTELVHDILDLQIRLTKEKQHKSQIMSELQLQKSLNKSQEISQYVQYDISQIYKEIRSIILSRQNFITTEESLNRLTKKINELEKASQQTDKDPRLMYLVEEKSRRISKELQVMKSALFKMNLKDIQPYQCKTVFANILKPCQTAVNELLAAVEEMVNTFV